MAETSAQTETQVANGVFTKTQVLDGANGDIGSPARACAVASTRPLGTQVPHRYQTFLSREMGLPETALEKFRGRPMVNLKKV